MSDFKEPMISYWYRALHAPLGVELTCSDPEKVRQRLYVARREVQDSDLDDLSICVSPFDPAKLWIIKRGASTDET